MKILAIHAHPDDVELQCAGTLVLLKEQGCEILIATLSNGDKGTPDKSQEEIAAIRKEEARRSAALLGAEYACLEFRDLEIFDDDDSRRRVTEFLRQSRPDLIIAASPQDYMADHETAGLLVRHASFSAPLRNYQAGTALVLDRIPHLYYADPLEGKDAYGTRIEPDFCVDIAPAMAMKEQMLVCHASQREWLLKHHGVDCYVESMKEWARRRGEEYGCEYGEGFRQHKGHAYPQENVLVQWLPSDAVRTRNI